MAKATQVATTSTKDQLPAHLQGGKKAKFGNIDTTRDLIIPRVKLLQAISPEVAELSLPGAAPGQFWHTIAAEPMGDKLKAVPLLFRASIVLWAPRNDDRGILARSSDGVHWDSGFANLEFEVKPKGAPKPIKINTGERVASSFVVGQDDGPSLADFGSSVPGDPKSAPMASLTYQFMFWFPDFVEYSPAIVINTRSSVRAAKQLISKIELRPVDSFGQVYEIGVTDERGDEGPYKGYSYTAAGYVDEQQLEITRGLYDRFADADWKANEEGDDTPTPGEAPSTKKF